MRILWLGNVPWAPSGYGEQAALFLPRLRDLGHELAVAANYGLNGTRLEWNGMTVYPSDNDWGNHHAVTYAKHFEADLILVLHDAWVLRVGEWAEGPPVAIWAPVDHDPIPPPVLATLSHPRVRPIAMSRFGEKQIEQFGIDAPYVPHGVDTSVFAPHPDWRDAVRDELDIPRDAFLVGMVAANQGNPMQPRKGWPNAFKAFARFAKDHDDAYLYCHTKPDVVNGQGMDLNILAASTGMHERISFANQEQMTLGMSNRVLAATYSAFDVLLNPSWGEGFGIPILEAQACGVPVIVSDHSAMTELCGSGWLVGGDENWDGAQHTNWFWPFIESIRACLEEAHDNRDNDQVKIDAVEFASGYDADLVTEQYWKPSLEQLSRPREAAPLGPNRAARRKMKKVKA
jgi:glycosyltransferase involved in cell wall biosynthesis